MFALESEPKCTKANDAVHPIKCRMRGMRFGSRFALRRQTMNMYGSARRHRTLISIVFRLISDCSAGSSPRARARSAVSDSTFMQSKSSRTHESRFSVHTRFRGAADLQDGFAPVSDEFITAERAAPRRVAALSQMLITRNELFGGAGERRAGSMIKRALMPPLASGRAGVEAAAQKPKSRQKKDEAGERELKNRGENYEMRSR